MVGAYSNSPETHRTRFSPPQQEAPRPLSRRGSRGSRDSKKLSRLTEANLTMTSTSPKASNDAMGNNVSNGNGGGGLWTKKST